MKLTNQSLISIASALTQLDGLQQSDGTRKQHKLSWRATYAQGRTLAIAKPLLEAYEKARQFILAPLSGGRGYIDQSDPKFLAAQDALRPLLDLEVEIEPHRFKVSDLKLEENEKAGTPIPGSVLSALLPILDDDTVG